MKEMILGRIILTAVVGSHSHNLADETSDVDRKTFVMPTFDDLYNRESVSIKINDDHTIHDIRQLSNMLWKSNVNFLDVIFSDNLEFNKNDFPEIQQLIDMREDIAHIDLQYLFSSCMGIHHQLAKQVPTGTTNTKHLVKKFGYDTKSAMNAYRILDFLERYAKNEFKDFKAAMRYSDDEKPKLLDMKLGKTFKNLEYFRGYILNKLTSVKQEFGPIYNSKEPNEKLHGEVENLIKDMVHNHLIK